MHAALKLYRPLEGASKRLICLPHAGGGASTFNAWRQTLAASNIELCAMQLPGRENRLSEAPLLNASAIVEHLQQAATQLRPLPTAVLGHSMGSLIGYLLCLKWQQENAPAPLRFIASASLSPSSRSEIRDTYKLPDEAFKEKVFAHDGVPAQLRAVPELMEMFLPVLRADYGVFDQYIYGETQKLNCPVSVYSGRDDKAVPLQQLSRWQEIASNKVTIRDFEGGHFYLYKNIELVKEALLDDMRFLDS